MPRILSPALALVLALASPVAAERVPLGQQPEITGGLVAVAIAYEIGEQCTLLSARMFRGLGYLNSLRSRARRLGYSAAEVQQFMDDRSEKRRLEALAWDQFAALGGQRDQPESFCAVGQAQIAADTQVGRLLR